MKWIIFCLYSSQLFAEVPAIMKDLVALRAELETISQQTEALQKEQQAELDLWTQKKLELESSLQKESLRRLQLQEKTNILSARVNTENKTDPKAKQQLTNWIIQAKDWVNSAVPFRKEQRLQTLAALQERVERGMESLESLSAELWMFYEAEFKMAADNEFRIMDQSEVVRLGAMTMFVRHTDGQIQQSVNNNGVWSFTTLVAEQAEDASRLIENMKAKRESGVYTLPISSVKERL